MPHEKTYSPITEAERVLVAIIGPRTRAPDETFASRCDKALRRLEELERDRYALPVQPSRVMDEEPTEQALRLLGDDVTISDDVPVVC